MENERYMEQNLGNALCTLFKVLKEELKLKVPGAHKYQFDIKISAEVQHQEALKEFYTFLQGQMAEANDVVEKLNISIDKKHRTVATPSDVAAT